MSLLKSLPQVYSMSSVDPLGTLAEWMRRWMSKWSSLRLKARKKDTEIERKLDHKSKPVHWYKCPWNSFEEWAPLDYCNLTGKDGFLWECFLGLFAFSFISLMIGWLGENGNIFLQFLQFLQRNPHTKACWCLHRFQQPWR